MSDRETAIRRIAVGDIFHASAPNGASFICLALIVGADAIFARRVTTQSVHHFDRKGGIEDADKTPAIIDSVAPLPSDIQAIMLGIDRKYREAEYRRAEDPGRIELRESMALTDEQQHGLLFAGKFYRANPL